MNMACLQRKLVFGDEEQIKAIRFLEREVECDEEQQALIDAGELKHYSVTVEVEGQVDIRVLAKNAIEAKRIAEEMVDTDEIDFEISSSYAREMN